MTPTNSVNDDTNAGLLHDSQLIAATIEAAGFEITLTIKAVPLELYGSILNAVFSAGDKSVTVTGGMLAAWARVAIEQNKEASFWRNPIKVLRGIAVPKTSFADVAARTVINRLFGTNCGPTAWAAKAKSLGFESGVITPD